MQPGVRIEAKHHGAGNGDKIEGKIQFCVAGHIMKIIAVIIMLVILGSLASAMVFLVKDGGKTKRTVNALTVRISLSVALFVFLMFGYWMGWFRSSHPLG